jgi:pentatricopeptide repeat protein
MISLMSYFNQFDREEAYGAVMHSLVASRRTDEAHDLFKSLERKETPGIARPGPTCFDASLLACLQTGDWDKALELHEKRTESSVPLTPSGFQGALIASFRRGGRGQALKYAEEMLGSNTELDQACCEVSMKILLRDLVPQSNISDTRGKLRAICEEDSELHSASIALLRSLRIAEAEQKRRVSNALTERELSRRRQKAWREALFHVVDLMKIANEQGKLVSSNTSTKSAKDSAVLPVAS